MALSLNLLTLYADLQQQLAVRAERHGTIYRQKIKGGTYAYSRRNVGRARRDVFLGREDDEDVQARVELIRAETTLAKDRRKIVSALKAAGFPAPPTETALVLDALDDAGVLRQIVIVGTAAYQIYAPLLGAIPEQAYRTSQDADFATMSLAISGDAKNETLETILRRADLKFTGRLGLDRKSLPSSFRAASGFMVDLLTPIFRRDDPNPMPLPNLKAGATPLQHLKWLVENAVPIAVLHGSGIPAFVPQPARFAIHKFIIAQKRAVNREKRFKDLAQAKAIIDILKTRDPYALEDARDAAFADGKEGWEVPIRRSLKELKLNSEFEAV